MKTRQLDLVQKSHLVIEIKRGNKESLEYTPKLFVKQEIQSHCAGEDFDCIFKQRTFQNMTFHSSLFTSVL